VFRPQQRSGRPARPRYARRPAQSVSDAVTRAAGRGGGSEHCRPGPERLNLTGEDSIMVAGTALPW
jgi:hypothetical protein